MKIKVIKKNDVTSDCTIGKEYTAVRLSKGTEGMDYKIHDDHAVQFVDDVGDECIARDDAGYVEVVEEA